MLTSKYEFDLIHKQNPCRDVLAPRGRKGIISRLKNPNSYQNLATAVISITDKYLKTQLLNQSLKDFADNILNDAQHNIPQGLSAVKNVVSQSHILASTIFKFSHIV